MKHPYCCVPSCKHTESNCRLRSFPRSERRADEWEESIRRHFPTYVGKVSHRCCECHFSEDQFDIDVQYNVRRLKRNFVPNRFDSAEPRKQNKLSPVPNHCNQKLSILKAILISSSDEGDLSSIKNQNDNNTLIKNFESPEETMTSGLLNHNMAPRDPLKIENPSDWSSTLVQEEEEEEEVDRKPVELKLESELILDDANEGAAYSDGACLDVTQQAAPGTNAIPLAAMRVVSVERIKSHSASYVDKTPTTVIFNPKVPENGVGSGQSDLRTLETAPVSSNECTPELKDSMPIVYSSVKIKKENEAESVQSDSEVHESVGPLSNMFSSLHEFESDPLSITAPVKVENENETGIEQSDPLTQEPLPSLSNVYPASHEFKPDSVSFELIDNKAFSRNGGNHSFEVSNGAGFTPEWSNQTACQDPENHESGTERGSVPCESLSSSENDSLSPKKEILFTCGYCPMKFTTESGIMDHMKAHSKNGASKLVLVREEFKSHYSLKKHLNKHNHLRFKCKNCPDRFATQKLLKSHLLEHAKELRSSAELSKLLMPAVVTTDQVFPTPQTYSCMMCSGFFHSESDLQLHLSNHASEMDCSFLLYSAGPNYRKIIKKDHSDKSSTSTGSYAQCSSKYRKILKKPDVVRTDKESSAPKLYACKLCLERFHSEWDLQVHQCKHPREKSCTGPPAKRKKTLKKSAVSCTDESSAPKAHFCKLCSAQFPAKYDLQQHEATHAVDKLYICKYCSARFPTEMGLKNHEVKHFFKKPYWCKQCPERFSSERDLQSHEREHPNKLYCCVQCSERFHSEADLQAHEKNHSEKPYSCTQCSERFDSEEDLRLHEQNHSIEKCHSRTQCSEGFHSEEDRQSPVQRHCDEKPYSCTQCSEQFHSEEDVESHEQRHLDERTYPHFTIESSSLPDSGTESSEQSHSEECPQSPEQGDVDENGDPLSNLQSLLLLYACMQCSERFDSEEDLQFHEWRHSDEKPVSGDEVLLLPHHCWQCLQRFSSEADLQVHERSHSYKPYHCKQCSEPFHSEADLRLHKETHSDGQAHSCTRCSTPFLSECYLGLHEQKHYVRYGCMQCDGKSHLERGLRAHKRAYRKRYSCMQCSAHFHSEYERRFHVLTHSDVEQYSCMRCLAQFHTECDLRLHDRRHSDKKSYSCTWCSVGLHSECDLRLHEQRLCDGGPYSCTQCLESFLSECDLWSHEGRFDGKRYSCTQCLAFFLSECDLRLHERKHSKKLHSCTLCSKEFQSEEDLQLHERGHAGKKVYSCSQCSARFDTAVGLNQHVHVDSVTSEKTYSCTQCSESFKYRHELVHHEVSVHTPVAKFAPQILLHSTLSEKISRLFDEMG